MKKIFLLLALLLIIKVDSKAQGNLQFNQVLTYQGSISYFAFANQTFSINGVQWTVPQNKVWKIENKTRTPYGYLRFMINGIFHDDLYERTNQNGALTIAIDNSPIWLKANDVINFSTTGQAGYYGASGTLPYSVSIIEYNIVQQ